MRLWRKSWLRMHGAKMAAATPFSKLTKDFSDERKALIDKKQRVLFMEHDLLAQLRKGQDLTPEEEAEIVETREAAFSMIENREDALMAALERYIQALGGELELRAKFPDREVALKRLKHSSLDIVSKFGERIRLRRY